MNLNIEERECLIFLQNVDGFGAVTIRELKEMYGSYQTIYGLSEETVLKTISPKKAANFIEARKNKDPKRLFNNMISRNIRHVAFEDDRYPDKLKNIPDPPVGLFIKGKIPKNDIPLVAIIGARNNTLYGETMAKAFAGGIASNGIGIVSGLARGIDSIAQEATVRAGGRTYAVLGCGADICYPTSSKALYYDILKTGGGIISEYPPGTPPVANRFPPRNRIISGLSDAVLVMEAKEKSGTMITVDMALEQGREVHALPGRTDDPLSKGCNELIRQGAGILQTPEEFLNEFLENISTKNAYRSFFDGVQTVVIDEKKKKIFLPTSPEERAIYNVLDYNPLPVGVILERVNKEVAMPLPNLLQWLTNMTISGHATCVFGNNYCKL